jgi:hypothetical protein
MRARHLHACLEILGGFLGFFRKLGAFLEKIPIRLNSFNGVRVEHGSADVTANKNEITNSSNTTQKPVGISFHEARSHCAVDGCAASV